MLRIRLRRTGARKKPQYRLVVAESTSPRDGLFIEIIGTYNPLTNPSTINVKEDRAKHWLSVGATPSVRVHKILAGQGLMEPPKFVKAAAERAAASVADEAATSAAMAPAAEEAGASGPISNLGEDSGATEQTVAEASETTGEAGEPVAEPVADVATTPDAASEAV